MKAKARKQDYMSPGKHKAAGSALQCIAQTMTGQSSTPCFLAYERIKQSQMQSLMSGQSLGRSCVNTESVGWFQNINPGEQNSCLGSWKKVCPFGTRGDMTFSAFCKWLIWYRNQQGGFHSKCQGSHICQQSTRDVPKWNCLPQLTCLNATWNLVRIDGAALGWAALAHTFLLSSSASPRRRLFLSQSLCSVCVLPRQHTMHSPLQVQRDLLIS